MKYTGTLTAAFALALSCTTVAAATPAGKVVGWQGGTAEVMIWGHDEPVGRVHEDGSVTFDLPTPPETGQTVTRTFSRCRTSELTVVNGEADVAPTMLYLQSGEEQVGMVAADSPEMAAYQLSWGQTELVKGSFLRWVHVAGDAAVTGRCVEEQISVSGPIEVVTEMDLNLKSGWNLVRTTNLEIIRHADGTAHETHTRYDALQAFPAEAAWYLESK
jgi:hypothetical protein